jgi:phage terminase large subunit-like protein
MAIRKATRNRWRARHIEPVPSAPTEIVLSARQDVGLLGEYVAGKTPAPHHCEWFPHLRTGQDSECLKFYAGENTDLLAPRGSAKSTWAAIIAADVIGHNPHVQMLYLSNSTKIALRQSRLIKRIIESPKYREVFPHIRPGKRWADTDWEIDKVWAGVNTLDSDATFAAAGITGSIVGMRTHFIFGDDLIKSSAAIKNEEVREKMRYNFFEVIEPTLIPGGRILDVGTLFRRDDIHRDFEEEGWKVIRTSAIKKVAKTIAVDESSGRVIDVDIEEIPPELRHNFQYKKVEIEESYWDRYKLEALQRLKEKRPVIFLFQFQNQLPPNDDDVVIKPEWIKYGEPPEEMFDSIAIGADLAASEDNSSDWTVFIVAGRIGMDFWMLDNVRGRYVSNHKKLEVLKELRGKWVERTVRKEIYFVPESGGYQNSLKGDFKIIFVRQWEITNVRVRPTPSTSDKRERLEGVSGIFDNGLVKFNAAAKWSRVVDELTLQATDHDDCADATEKALAFLQRRNSSSAWSD